MIFELESLICPFCNKCFNEPKVLPCGENACSKCLPETGNFNCLLCSESHSVSTNGYPINKILSKALENTIKSEKLDNKAQSFMVNIEDTEKKLSELKLKMVQLEAEVVENCNSIINEIDLAAEDKINQINNIRDDLIKEVKEYQDKCLNNLTKFSKDHAQLLDQVNFLTKDKDLILTCKNFNKKIDKYYSIKSEVEIGLKKIRNLSFDYRKIHFDACESELEKDFLGTVYFKNLKKKNLNELKQPIKVDFSEMFLEKGSIKFNKLDNGNFILSYIKLNINYEMGYNKESSKKDNSLTVVYQEDGTFFKKIDPYPTKFENIVKITNDFIIITHRFNTLEFRNSNGCLSDYIEYDSYNFIALIDDNNEIFLMNSLRNQFHTDKFE
ncbi:unnamed protein product [Brachionus calyciflorus]|uniref:RING-type domain-containing protein n=1 Tax=Brachionus calyciflorus TaxID=104777 RepID=A0A814F4Q7_9BILA|nr:unnamed protein product [Brachionus calyciflorus]